MLLRLYTTYHYRWDSSGWLWSVCVCVCSKWFWNCSFGWSVSLIATIVFHDSIVVYTDEPIDEYAVCLCITVRTSYVVRVHVASLVDKSLHTWYRFIFVTFSLLRISFSLFCFGWISTTTMMMTTKTKILITFCHYKLFEYLHGNRQQLNIFNFLLLVISRQILPIISEFIRFLVFFMRQRSVDQKATKCDILKMITTTKELRGREKEWGSGDGTNEWQHEYEQCLTMNK